MSRIASDIASQVNIRIGAAANKLQRKLYQDKKTANYGTCHEEHLQPVKIRKKL